MSRKSPGASLPPWWALKHRACALQPCASLKPMNATPIRRPLQPSRSETFPYRERVLLHGETPIMHFDEGAGHALVFVHGLGANMTHFEYLVPALRAAGYRVCGL